MRITSNPRRRAGLLVATLASAALLTACGSGVATTVTTRASAASTVTNAATSSATRPTGAPPTGGEGTSTEAIDERAAVASITYIYTVRGSNFA